VKELVQAARRGDFAGAADRQVKLAELIRAMFVETNPGPVKAGVALLGRAGPELRLPLAPVSEASLARIRAAMQKFGLELA
jgi:4-hydroxy-tetrahydrodipicolinate synthase